MRIVIGTRGSQLALIQSYIVARMIETAGGEVKIQPIKTSGDMLGDEITEPTGKGVFVKELDEALLDGRIDIAVHSMKDVPAILPHGISIAAVPMREDARDALISTCAPNLTDLPRGARIGTSSPRRRAQILKLRPDLNVVPVRGNIETRLKKLDAGDVDALVLAAAGLVRLGISEVIAQYLPVGMMIPAIGQGALAVTVRTGDHETVQFIGKVCHHQASGFAICAERSLLQTVGGDCHTPLAAHAGIYPKGLTLRAFMATPNLAQSIIDTEVGPIEDAAEIGRRLGERLLNQLQLSTKS